ncbi:hypothetical protein DTO96_100349 [Ephemeroptericola cinctiostellae]|uniref:Uncharacterized protein n=1 Tax=Ephemeroptericola cinctiostellae TaxID=2268024 RepID=A0A345D8F1_9BURK|nr:hypothetical protein DTO96_100349 [Ephemeroptericola cinctiostellae]
MHTHLNTLMQHRFAKKRSQSIGRYGGIVETSSNRFTTLTRVSQINVTHLAWRAVLTADYKKQNNRYLIEHVIIDIQLFKQDAHGSASTHIAHRMALGLTASVKAQHRDLKCTPSTNLPKSMGSRQDDTAWTVRKGRTIKILFHSFTLRPHSPLNNAVRAVDRAHVWTSVFDGLSQGTDKHPAKHQTIRENRLNLFTIASPFEKAKNGFFELLF